VSDKLKPYPKYKDSGIPSLGKIPDHWDVRRNGRLFAQRNEMGFGELPILEVSLRTGVRVRDMDNLKRKQVMSDAEKYKRAEKGDIAYNMMRMWQGALGTAPVDGLVSPAYVVARPFEETNPNYYSYLFRTEAYKAEVDGFSRGIVKDRNRLYWQDFKQMPSCFPPPNEQAAIVRFLDANAVLVRQFIRNRRRLIEVLTEQKQAMISRAVTRGLDANAKMKASGVDWLGEVPEHWIVGTVKSEMDNLNTRRIPLSGSDRGLMKQRMYDYYGASGVIDKVDEYIFDDELLLIAEDGANLLLRNLPLAIMAKGKFWVNNHAHILKPKRGSLEYFFHLFEQIDYTIWVTGAAQPKLTQSRLMAVQIPVPPPEEQMAICDWIFENTKDVGRLIQNANQEMDAIQAFRQRLVTDVVSGAADVRQVEISNTLAEEEQFAGECDEYDLTDEEEIDGEVVHADD